VENEEKNLVWAHIFMCGVLKDKQESDLFVARVLALREDMRNEVMDEMARMIPPSAKGQKVWDTFWSTAEKEGKFKRIIRDETARRVTDAALAGLLVGENTGSVSMGVLLVTECKLVEDFFMERQIVMPENFRFPKDEERGVNALGVAAAKNMMIMFKKLELYWGVKNPSFVWLQYVTQIDAKVLPTEVDALRCIKRSALGEYRVTKRARIISCRLCVVMRCRVIDIS
jgi:hypothetical protein